MPPWAACTMIECWISLGHRKLIVQILPHQCCLRWPVLALADRCRNKV